MEQDTSRTTRLSSINRNNNRNNNNNNSNNSTNNSSMFTSLSQPQLNSISQLADVQRRIGLIRNRSLLRATQREARVLEGGGGDLGGEMTLDEDLRNEAFRYIMHEAQRVSNEEEGAGGRGIGGRLGAGNLNFGEDEEDQDGEGGGEFRDHFWVDGSDDDDDDDDDDNEEVGDGEEEDQEMMEPESFYERESSFLPGLFATYPLNPSEFNATNRRRINRRRISPTPTPGSLFQTPQTSPPPSSERCKLSKLLLSDEELALLDDHTSSAPTSFLQTGVVFVGVQYYIPSVKKSHPRSLSDSEDSPSFSTNPSSHTSRHSQPLPPPRLPMSIALESIDRPSLALVQNLGRRNLDDLSIGEMEAQISAYQIESDILRQQTRRFQEAHRITMDYLRRTYSGINEGITNEESSSSGSSSRSRDEKWEVKVFIESYNHATQSLTGLMQATNVPFCPSVVTTSFVGKVLNPITTFLNWSENDIDFWHQLGKFKTSTKEEMWIRRKDVKWIEQMMKGWIYMYWQEEQFINLTASESKLSIQGRYIVALERSSGVIEGVYNDPHSIPTQRISLSACRNDSIGFSTFSYA